MSDAPPPAASVPAAAGADHTKLDKAIIRLGLAVVLGSIMSVLDTTIVNVALQTLSKDLHAPLSQVQWVVTAYLLAIAAVIPISGWATRRFGVRKLYLGSIILFTLGSALCGFSWSITSLVIFRVIQGIGGGLILPVGQTAIARASGPARMGRVMSLIGIPTVLGPILGPTVGGLILEHLSWSWIFFVNVPIGVVAVLVALRYLPHDHDREPAGAFDGLGLALAAVGLPLAIYGIAQSVTSPLWQWLTPLVIGLVLLVAFVRHALHTAKPLLDMHLYRSTAFSAASAATFCLGTAIMGGMILFPLYYQVVRGTDPVTTGLLLIPQGIGAATGMAVAGRLVDRFGGGVVSFVGVVVATVATVPLVAIGGHTPYWVLSAVLFFRGAGVGCSMMPAMAAAFAVLRPRQIADASPQLNVLQRVSGSIGTAIFAVVLQQHIARVTVAAHGHPTSNELASAFGVTFAASLVILALAAIPTLVLWVIEWRVRRRHTENVEITYDEEGVSMPLLGMAD